MGQAEQLIQFVIIFKRIYQKYTNAVTGWPTSFLMMSYDDGFNNACENKPTTSLEAAAISRSDRYSKIKCRGCKEYAMLVKVLIPTMDLEQRGTWREEACQGSFEWVQTGLSSRRCLRHLFGKEGYRWNIQTMAGTGLPWWVMSHYVKLWVLIKSTYSNCHEKCSAHLTEKIKYSSKLNSTMDRWCSCATLTEMTGSVFFGKSLPPWSSS